MPPSRPLKVSELVAQAEEFSFNPNIPLKHWTRAAETLYQEANFALSDDDYGRAFLMLYRHSILVLKHLPHHPEYKTIDGKKACRPLSKRVPRVIEDMEQLKPELTHAYKEWERMEPPKQPFQPLFGTPSPYADFASRDPTLTGNAKILDASEHQDLAVDLAQKELTRRDTVRWETRQAGLSEHEALKRQRASRWDDWPSSSVVGQEDDLQKQMEAARRNLDSPGSTQGPVDTKSSHAVPQHYNYPSIAKSTPIDYDATHSQAPVSSTAQPLRPPKQPLKELESRELSAALTGPPPLPPRKIALDDYKPLVPSPSSQTPKPPVPELPPKTVTTPPPHPKKERLTFKPGSYLENGDPIRSVFLPRALRRSFLEIAADNTRRGVEMCGILCGTPINNALFIRCLLIPDQKCTSDTCETENESALFDYCDSEDLLMLGWIHTHPTQTCFMSSRDLHTHAGYQIMMPESIAIVCAPKFTPS